MMGEAGPGIATALNADVYTVRKRMPLAHGALPDCLLQVRSLNSEPPAELDESCSVINSIFNSLYRFPGLYFNHHFGPVKPLLPPILKMYANSAKPDTSEPIQLVYVLVIPGGI